MRKSQRKAAEIEAEELTEFKRRSKRDRVYKEVLPERERGWGRLIDYDKGRDVRMEWFTDRFPGNKFGLRIGGQLLVLDAEEVRRYLRWV